MGVTSDEKAFIKHHNIILFGEAGCGKSSIVNLLVGEAVAKVSNDAEGCTFQNECYSAQFGDTEFRIHDTAGLNEGEGGRVPHWKAIQGLYRLIRQLDGVSLLIFCMRGRVRGDSRANWVLFNKVICGEQVPIIAAVTGLEHEPNLDDWWKRPQNQEVFKRNQMFPEDACGIVSVRGDHNEHERKYKESQAKLRNLVEKHYRREPWSEEKDDWFARIYCRVQDVGICFFARSRVEFAATMKAKFGEFVREANMSEDVGQKLEKILVKAEKMVEDVEKKTKKKRRTRQRFTF